VNAQRTPSLLTHLVEQLHALERRSRRRAVWVSVAVPACMKRLDVERALEQYLRREDGTAPEVELVPSTDGRPRLLTVDYEMREAL